MLSLRKCGAILNKELKDILKNKEVLVLFIVYPLITLVLTKSIGNETGQTGFFLTLFSTMHSIFTPIVVIASIIAEEKEKNTLRVLILSNVHPLEYLISIGSFVLMGTLLTSFIFIGIGAYSTIEAMKFLAVMSLGSLTSIILGMPIGAGVPNLMAANGIAVPLAMCLAFLPMIASFNNKVKGIAGGIYSQQISQMIEKSGEVSLTSIGIILANALLIGIGFVTIFRKNKLEV